MEKKLGLSALTALVLSSMLGAGVFSLPQNMAAVASPAALLIGWGITGAGILLLAYAMLILTRIRPELDGGIFTYAREGFGELIGFCSAWGYWLCAVIANVSYLVIVFSALSFFTDTPELRLFGDGNTWQSIVGASALLWIVHFLILRGVQTAASINLVATLAKLLPLGLFVVLAMMMFKLDTFKLDFTGLALGVPVWEQVKNTMLITLWVFIGVEGAVVVSARARNKRDVGKATLLAVLSALGVYLLVTLLSLGVVARPELAEIRNPSMAGLMVEMMGPWGEIIIAAGLIVSVCGAYLSWTIMAAEVPFLAATHKAFPRIFARQNAQAAPSASLWLTNTDLPLWLSTHLADIQAVTPDKTVRIKTLAQGHYAALDMRLMERVLDNLLNNALRYCHSTVETSLLLSGNRATLIVEDDGPGIAPENREHIFEPFVRLDPSRDRSTGGCGLGLAIVHSIALAMGGTVNCDTSELGGARFSFSWPLWHNIPQFTSA